MNKSMFINILTAFIVLFSASAFSEDEAKATDETETELLKNLGYFYGYSFGNMLRQGGGDDADFDSLIQGLQDSLSGGLPVLSPEQQEAVVNEIRSRQMAIAEERQREESVQQQAAEVQSLGNLAQAESYLAENGARADVVTTTSGLQYEVIKDVAGTNAASTDRVSVNYRGTLIDGSVFDESTDVPAEFGLDQVIPGWTEGLQLMSAGDEFRFFLHPNLAYGAGSVGSIPPNSLLIFEVELLSIK